MRVTYLELRGLYFQATRCNFGGSWSAVLPFCFVLLCKRWQAYRTTFAPIQGLAKQKLVRVFAVTDEVYRNVRLSHG